MCTQWRTVQLAWRLQCGQSVDLLPVSCHVIAARADQVCPEIEVVYSTDVESVVGSVCSSAAGTYSRSNSNFNNRPFFVSDGGTVFYIYHTNLSSNGWRLSTSPGSAATEACEFGSGATVRDDVTMGPIHWASLSPGEVVTLACSAENQECYRNGSRPSGCSCEFSTNGGIKVNDPALCTSGCCRNGICEQTQAWCLRWYIVGGVLLLVAILSLAIVHGVMNHKGRRVTPEGARSVEKAQRQSWDAEVAEAASRGFVMVCAPLGLPDPAPVLVRAFRSIAWW
jgi:hypothetical protein